MTEKDRIINEFVDALVNGDQYTAEELLIKAFDAGYDMGYSDGREETLLDEARAVR